MTMPNMSCNQHLFDADYATKTDSINRRDPMNTLELMQEEHDRAVVDLAFADTKSVWKELRRQQQAA